VKTLSPSEVATMNATAAALGVPASWLAGVINFETAGTWNPQIKNPLSSARGLIQWIDSTARGMGYDSAAALVAAHPTIESQLSGPVLKYFKPYMPFKTEQEFYFTVFFPKYRKAAMDTVIYADDAAARAKFQAANPGIVTVGDYYSKLKKAFSKFHGGTPAKAGGALLAVALVVSAIFF